MFSRLRISTVVFCLAVGALLPAVGQAQSLRIQTWNSRAFPHAGIGYGFPYGPIGVPRYDSFRFGYSSFYRPGISIGIGVPTPYYGFGYGVPYSDWRYRHDYFDYRTDYYRRLNDSYRWQLERDLWHAYPEDFLGLPPAVSARPPVARIEPFGSDDFVPQGPYQDLLTPPPGDDHLQEPAAADLPSQLASAARRLQVRLLAMRDGEIWADYLKPDRVMEAAEQGRLPDDAAELLRNYDGVVGNPELRWVAALDGFAATRSLLRNWLASVGEQPAPAPRPPIPPKVTDKVPDNDPFELNRAPEDAIDADTSDRTEL